MSDREKIFNNIISLKNQIQNLASFVQNEQEIDINLFKSKFDDLVGDLVMIKNNVINLK